MARSKTRALRPRTVAIAIIAEALVIAAVATFLLLRPGYELRRGGPRQDVVVLMVDALRADHLGVYGHDVPTSPFVDSLAPWAILFENVRSQSTWTKPSIASLFTSLYTFQHTVSREPEGHQQGPAPPIPHRGTLPEQLVTVAETFRANGYRTAAFITNVWLEPGNGFERGFDDYFDLSYVEGPDTGDLLYQVLNLGAGAVHRQVKEYLWELRAPTFWRRLLAGVGVYPRPLFVYVHYMDVHGPYTPPKPFLGSFEAHYLHRPDRMLTEEEISAFVLQPERSPRLNHYIARYDEQIRYLDFELQDLFGWLGDSMVLRHPLVALTSDHGEAFGEHEHFMHGGLPYEEVVRVPLILLGAENAPAGRRVREPVQLLDLAPTLLDLVGLRIPEQFEGASLKGLVYGQPSCVGPVWSEILNHSSPTLVKVDDGVKWFYDRLTNRVTAVYDLQCDPGEQSNLLATMPPEHAERKAESIRSWLEDLSSRVTVEGDEPEPTLDPDTRRRLEALGYLK